MVTKQKNDMNNLKFIYAIWFLTVSFCGCGKFLDEKSDKKLVVPTSLADCQALLDDHSNLRASEPADGEAAADDYYITDDVFAGLINEEHRRAYIWEPDYVCTTTSWSLPYRAVYYTNIVLQTLGNIKRDGSNQSDWDDIRGQALFLRSKAFLSVVTTWCLAYDKSTAMSDMGIPLRLNPDFNEMSTRSTLEESYAQIIMDLKESIELLKTHGNHLLRPSKPAAMGLLARTYLYMRDYDNCLVYSDACLRIKSALLDYNSLDTLAAYPLSQFNEEVICSTTMASYFSLNINRARVDSTLYGSYDANELRKMLLFRNNNNGSYAFKGGYEGSAGMFSGIATNEMYLMRAECSARLGDLDSAINDLNMLLRSRYRKGHFDPFFSQTQDKVLNLILEERRKELLFRGIRWPDIKRLNKEGANISLSRIVNGQEYVLAADDYRFAIAIPEAILERASGIEPNIR